MVNIVGWMIQHLNIYIDIDEYMYIYIYSMSIYVYEGVLVPGKRQCLFAMLGYSTVSIEGT